jgi:hypothetical protein
MATRNVDELKAAHSEPAFQAKFIALMSLQSFFRELIFTDSFQVGEAMNDHIVLTEYGERVYEKLRKDQDDYEDHEIKFGLFLKFYHEELLVDVERCDLKSVRNEMTKRLHNNDLMSPWVYDRLLYDKYFDEFEETDTALTNSDVKKLLTGTPIGVFQIGKTVIGPFGVLESSDFRYLPPFKSVRLWHCSDPSCQAFHAVDLKEGGTVYGNILEQIENQFQDIEASDYFRFFMNLITHENNFYDINRVHEAPIMLINCFSESELREVLKQVINSSKDFRQRFPSDKRLKGSAMAIASELTKAECAQLLLLVDDRQLIKSLEELIDSEIVHIPATEVREALFRSSGGFYSVFHQCNALGVRSIPDDPNISVVRLLNVIETIHRSDDDKRELEWRLMRYKRDSFKEMLENFVLSELPSNIVKDSLLYGRKQMQQVLELMYGNFAVPNEESEKKQLVNKILWKLGFDVNIYPNTLSTFWDKLNTFRSITAMCSNILSETEKDNVRSAGVNFFVLLEEVLEKTLAYNSWVLLSDHFLKTRFRYTFEEARDFMCDTLNGSKVGSGDPLRFDKSGNNTLFPLVEGFVALMNICDTYRSEERMKFSRDISEIPHFHQRTELTVFPFPSKVLLLDLKDSQYGELKSLMSELHREFAKNQVLSVRNRLEHKERGKKAADSFPTRDQILDAINAVESIFKILEEKGVYPNVFLFRSSIKDGYNRQIYEFEDSKGRIQVIKPIPQFIGCNLPDYEGPQLISSIFTIGNSGEQLHFKYQEQSEYLLFWKDFPKRRLLV